MNRRDFLIFVGTLGTGFVWAPFLGSICRLMPSYYYRHHTNGNSQTQDQGNNNDNSYIRAVEAFPIGDVQNKWLIPCGCGLSVHFGDNGDGTPDRVTLVGLGRRGGTIRQQ